MVPHTHRDSHNHAPARSFPSLRTTIKSPYRLPVRSIAFGMAIFLLSGCAMNRLVGGTSIYCDIAKPIHWSSSDDTETIKEVKSHNAVGKELCGWR